MEEMSVSDLEAVKPIAEAMLCNRMLLMMGVNWSLVWGQHLQYVLTTIILVDLIKIKGLQPC